MDDELLELCKKVYKLFPDWITGAWIDFSDDKELRIYRGLANSKKQLICPLYDSGYLLEKLPYELYGETIGVVRNRLLEKWQAEYGDGQFRAQEYIAHANTPLKALLKLVIALDDSGVKL